MKNSLRNQIIADCFARKTLTVDLNSFDTKLFENDDFIYRTDSATYEINLDSDRNRLSILHIAEEKLGRAVPLNTSEALKFVYEFEEIIKKPESNVSWSGLYEIRQALAGFVLAKIHNEKHEDVIAFVLNRLQKRNKDESHLRNIEAYFFEALLSIDMTSNEFFSALNKYNSFGAKKNISSRAITFAQKFGIRKITLAKQLYEDIVSSKDWETTFGVLPAHLLTSIYKTDPNYSFEKAKELLTNYPIHSLFFFGRIDFSSQKDFQSVIEIIQEIDSVDEQTVNQLTYLLCSLLKSEFLNEEVIKFCFQQFQNLFDSEVLDNKPAVIDAMTNWIENHEEERYFFLLENHANFGDFHLIENYFSRFKNSIFFFDFFQKLYHALKGKLKPGLFESAVNNFSRTDVEKTERSILDFLSHEELFWRKAGMHLLNTKDSGVHQINLLRLETEIEQLRALEVITEYNWNLENYLPMVLLLRNSSFSPVKRELQVVLSKLTFESYHDVLVEKISALLSNSAEDKKFIRPIKEALMRYHKLVEVKSSINDLNPMHNERNFMDLYYRLEHENRAEMMEKIKSGKGSFLASFFKPSIIVRGHSWKLEGETEVVPLEKIEHSFSIDARAFKNNELFEHQTNNYKSKY